MPQLAWHYTTGQLFKLIVADALLRPATAHIAKHEKPVVWFSLEQFWEPTAQKAWQQNGRVTLLGMKGTYEKGLGLARFGMAPSDLIRWPRLAKVANMPSSARHHLEQKGRDQGAMPWNWYGAIEPVALDRIAAIEVFDSKNWQRVS